MSSLPKDNPKKGSESDSSSEEGFHAKLLRRISHDVSKASIKAGQPIIEWTQGSVSVQPLGKSESADEVVSCRSCLESKRSRINRHPRVMRSISYLQQTGQENPSESSERTSNLSSQPNDELKEDRNEGERSNEILKRSRGSIAIPVEFEIVKSEEASQEELKEILTPALKKEVSAQSTLNKIVQEEALAKEAKQSSRNRRVSWKEKVGPEDPKPRLSTKKSRSPKREAVVSDAKQISAERTTMSATESPRLSQNRVHPTTSSPPETNYLHLAPEDDSSEDELRRCCCFKILN